MYSFVFMFLCILAIGFLTGKPGVTKEGASSRGGELYYHIFTIVMALSPVIGIGVASLCGMNAGMKAAISFAWIGISTSLPLSFLLARISGADKYEAYWQYVGSISRFRRNEVTKLWIWVSISSFLIGMAVLLFL